jgi:hypothetical protein
LPRTQDLLRGYFRSKSDQLRAAAQASVGDHSGLRGGHREAVVRIYLNAILPKRFGVGRGMVYGLMHRSREADIVIWDEANFPCLPLEDHILFFAESVRAVLEVKSSYSADEFADILTKCRAVRDIIALREPNLVEAVEMLQLDVASLKSGREHAGILRTHHHIASGAIVLRGGASLIAESVTDAQLEETDDAWPDALLLLEPGRVVVKHYEPIEGSVFGGDTYLEFIEAGDDALLVFTAALLGLISERSAHVEDPFYLARYLWDLFEGLPAVRLDFPATRPVPNRTPIWGE